MSQARFIVPASKMAVAHLVVVSVIYFYISASDDSSLLGLFTAIGLIFIGKLLTNAITLKLVLPDFLKQNNLILTDGKKELKLTANPIIKLTLGMYWRQMIAIQIANLSADAVNNFLGPETMSSYIAVNVGQTFLFELVAIYLLLKFPFGKIHITNSNNITALSSQSEIISKDIQNDQNEEGGIIMGVILFLAAIAYGLTQVVVGYIGIEEAFGTFWAIVALIAAFMFRLSLPLTIGAFWGAMEVLDWHWALALIFVAPGLVFIIPGMIASVFSRNGR